MKQLLWRHRRLAPDTSVFVYQLEANAKWLSLTDAVFAWVERTGHEAVTSTMTMTELLEHGIATTADIAARLPATYKLRTPDALQAATAIVAQATGFITNDPIFLRVVEFETAVLDQFL